MGLIKIRTRKSKIIWIFFGILFLVIINGNIFRFILLTNDNTYENNETKLKNAGSWETSPFIIDDSGGGDYTWEEAVLQDWCSGSGTWNDPYIIENVTINDVGSKAISVKYSDKYFILRNCKSAINLLNVTNGKLLYNNASDGHMIYLLYSSNNTLIGNTANTQSRIKLEFSSNNSLINNTANSNWLGIDINNSHNNTIKGCNTTMNDHGIVLIQSYNNIVTNNTVSFNDQGIKVEGSSDNFVFNNIINNNSIIGLLLKPYFTSDCSDNVISGNFIYNNSIQAQDDGLNNNWDNASIGNYWDDYSGIDSNDDGIGDKPYNITGSAGSKDNYPIWWDAPVLDIVIPQIDDAFEASPYFELLIKEGIADTLWYTLDNGITNITFSGLNGTIDQLEWNKKVDGQVLITFSVNDSRSYISSKSLTIIKDTSNPSININSPIVNQLFNKIAPDYDLTIIDTNLDSIWYTLDGGTTNSTPVSAIGTINQAMWNAVGNGTVTIQFYANDTAGNLNYEEVIVYKDIIEPSIIINSPNPNDLFGSSAPGYDLTISDANLDCFWYTLDGGATNSTPVSASGAIDQTMWSILSNGTVTIRFYANDTLGNINYEEIMIRKDIIKPSIAINSPNHNGLFGSSAPDYDLTVTDANLHSIWYTLDGSVTNSTSVSASGTIDLTMWNARSNGTVTIRFYANDTLGNINYEEIMIRKDIIKPSIAINSPNLNELFRMSAPDYVLIIIDANLESLWYELTNGTYTTLSTSFTLLTGIINQLRWDEFGNGSVIIRFYANDTLGNLASQEITVRKDIFVPDINIILPIVNQLCGKIAPNYNITVSGSYINSMWYTFDDGITKIFFTTNGSIDQDLWNSLIPGIMNLKFYANDSLGNTVYQEVIIIKDYYPPIINLLFPERGDLFGIESPTFNIEINDHFLDHYWYSLDGGYTNITFTINGTIDQNLWDTFGNGTILITFYANDTLGNFASYEIIVRKDIIKPIITIYQPSLNQEFENFPPAFEISIDEPNLDIVWYTIDDGQTNYTITELIGLINENAWIDLPNGPIPIRFYSQDKVGNIGYKYVIIIKNAPTPTNPSGIPGYNILLLLGIVSTIAVIIVKKRLNHLN